MAALASSAVSLYPANNSSEFFPLGKDNRDIITRRLKLVLTGQGGATNTIGAAALGFTKLLECSNAFDAAGNILQAAVDPVNNIILLADATQAIADSNAEVYITITGTAKLSPAV